VVDELSRGVRDAVCGIVGGVRVQLDFHQGTTGNGSILPGGGVFVVVFVFVFVFVFESGSAARTRTNTNEAEHEN
jgi:hypothetical protein